MLQWRAFLPYVLIAVYGAILLLPFLDHGAVLSRHEVLAAEPAREMLAGAPWSVQTFAGELRTAKQPTMSWLIAGSMKLLDSRSTFACRLPSALAGIITAIAIASIGANLLDRSCGFLAGLITLTTYWLQMQSRLSEADMPLTAAVTVAMAILAYAIVSRGSIIFISIAFYTATGIAFMLKAPGVLVPLSGAIVYSAWMRDRRVRAMLLHPGGLVIICLSLFTWPAIVLLQHHEMLAVWWREIGERSAGQFGREKPTTPLSYLIDLPFYLWMSPFLLLPATPVAIVGAIAARKRWTSNQWKFVAAWIIPWLLLLTLLPLAKAKHYILPALPPLSLLAAFGTQVWIQTYQNRRLGITAAAAWFVGCLIVILFVQARVLPKFDDYEPSAALGRRASAMLPPGAQAVLLGLGESHIAYYLDPIPRRIDDPAQLPALGTFYVISDQKTLGAINRQSTVLSKCANLRKGETEDDRLVFAVIGTSR